MRRADDHERNRDADRPQVRPGRDDGHGSDHGYRGGCAEAAHEPCRRADDTIGDRRAAP